MFMILGPVIALGNSSCRINPLRVGLSSRSLPRYDLMLLQCLHQWA
uniref:Uncharacterized protein n=1 Tax=Arundo donax TaxID=35708 RepID=A0A0A9BFE5_ARUDO